MGMFRPLTVSLEKAGDAAIVHVLPQLLRLTTKSIHKPAETALAHSGRTVPELAAKYGVSVKETDKMVSPLQKEITGVVMGGYWGEKGVHNRLGGRVNVFNTVYAWAICSGIYPTILVKWHERIGKPLARLIEQGYCKTIYDGTK